MFGVEHDLDHARAVTQIDEHEAPVVPTPVHPACYANDPADVSGPNVSAPGVAVEI
jgi:hypothetical protein